MSVFKTYDIRGVYKKGIDEELAYNTGRALFTFLNKEKPVIAVGRDGRSSSPTLLENLKKGIIDSGGTVINTGVSNTPLLNFAVAKKKYDAGVMVTASHNPPEFNGFKIIRENAFQVYGEELQKIKKIIESKDFKNGEGKEVEQNFLQEYLTHVLSFTESYKDLKIVIDCGNGVGAVTAKPLFSKLNAEVFFLYDEIDGSFPNHLPDPGDSNSPKDAQKKIKKENADIGAIFDGDADRCIFLNENGKVISTDHLLSLLAREELKNNKGEKIYYDLRFTKTTKEEIEEGGGIPEMMRVGNPFYKEKIINEGGILGAELSGHIMFRENFGIDDGLFALVKTLNILSKKKEKISKLIAPFERYYQTEEINLNVRDKKEALKKLKEKFNDGEELFIDGVYIRYKDWWVSLRESNTEDLVRLRIEAEKEEVLKEKREQIISLIKEK